MDLRRDHDQIACETPVIAGHRAPCGRARRCAYLVAATAALAVTAVSVAVAAASVSFRGPVSAVVRHGSHVASAVVRSAVATLSLPQGWKPVYLDRHSAGAYPDHFVLVAAVADRTCSLQATLINQPVLTSNLPTVHLGGISDLTPVGPLGRPFNIAETHRRAGSVRVATRIGVRIEGGVDYISPFGDGGVPATGHSADLLGLAVFHAPLLRGVSSADRWAHAFIDIHWTDSGTAPSPCMAWADHHAHSAATVALRSVSVRTVP